MKNRALLIVLSSIVVACGNTVIQPAPVAQPAPADTDPNPPAAIEPPAAPLDHGAPSTKYPAFEPAMGQLTNNGGPVLKNPVVVTVTWPGDTQVENLESLGDTIGAGEYWRAVTSEYGSSAAVSGEANHVRIAEPAPASFSEAQLSAFVAANVGAAENAWPTPPPAIPSTSSTSPGPPRSSSRARAPARRASAATTTAPRSTASRWRSPSFRAAATRSTRSRSPPATSSVRRRPIRIRALDRRTTAFGMSISPGRFSSSCRARTATRASSTATPIFAPARAT